MKVCKCKVYAPKLQNEIHKQEKKYNGKSLVAGNKYHDNRKFPAQGDIFSD